MSRFVLSRLEYDLAWEALGLGEYPTVLTIDSHGHTMDERRELARRAWESLAAKGLAHRPGALDPDLADALTVLARPEWEVDARLRLDPHGPMLRALAASHGRTGVLATLTHEELVVEPIPETALARAVMGLLPPHPLPKSRSVSIPAEALDRAAAQAGESRSRLEAALRDQGVPWADAQKIGEVLGNVVRMGQFGAAHRSRRHGMLGRRERGPYVVSVYDTPTGRWQFTRRPSGDGRPWSTLAPADHQRLTHAVAELLGRLDTANPVLPR
ncbi:ESX secretion-associated protein EspG [Gandjariella thermophila]|uniref:ESX secretion-associated protein EspG n=1 Tax=Gandjariella thermophila TaxID=1931992 RepID=A0A4D4JI56_9PSEU|nr:ESX secretion-associated protein EspG [Gandjariella thermophila]GDY33959.1 hypothetical protein GTS_55920 [Gandjariella thermophila]